MGRKVKLQDSGLIGDSSINYKAPNGKYYTSKEIHDTIESNNQYRLKCIDWLVNEMEFENVPTFMLKKLKDYSNYEAVYRVLTDKADTINCCIHRIDFKSDINMISYVFAIVSNNYSAAVKYLKYRDQVKRKEEAVDDGIDIEIVNQNNNSTKDISKWLGDD